MANNYISVWGLDGASKSTSISSIHRVLASKGHRVVNTRKPGGTPLAEEARRIHKRTWDENISPFTELMLMMLSFSQTAENIITPTLLAGGTIIEDRGWGCTYAYQIFERQTHLESLFFDLIEHAQLSTLPSKVLLLDVEPEEGLRRSKGRGELDRLEQQHIEFFHRAQRGYKKLAALHPNLIHVVDANKSEPQVQKDVAEWAMTL